MLRKDALSKVKVYIDECTPFDAAGLSLAGDILPKPVDQYIDALLDEAADSVRLLAPLFRLSKKNLPDDIVVTAQPLSDGFMYYTLPLPEDFLRIANISMSGWHRTVPEAIAENSEAYKLLRNPHTTAGVSKPAVVVTGNRMELYGSRVPGATLVNKEYVHKEYFSDTIDHVQDNLVVDAICRRCALSVLGIMERTEAWKHAHECYQEALLKLV
ncbi:MAG: hypothetical protein LBD87_06280 [Prevotellaceae bacterium]|jgi:hypothetical protein|nr:hypothetical protein [Prevotellaceae bacterium]